MSSNMKSKEEAETYSSIDDENTSERSIGLVSRRTVLGSSAAIGAVGLFGSSVIGNTSSTFSNKDEKQDEKPDGKIDVGEKGMVVTNQPVASYVGANVLRDGGNAIDATVAIHFALSAAEVPMTGLGGGGTMVYYDANKDNVISLDFYQRAPSAVTPEYWLGDDERSPLPEPLRVSSGLSVAVPGTVKGMSEAHKKFGSYPWKQLVQPVINLAEGGIIVDSSLGSQIEENWDRFNDAAKDTFSGPDEEPLEAGELLVQKKLADTFRLIRDKGAAGFYKGEVAKALAETVQRNRGKMTVDDLRNREVWFDEPMHGEYRGIDLYNPQLPITAGFLVPRMLNDLEEYNVSEKYGIQSWKKHHIFAESATLAWADREKYLGDSDFVEVPVEGLKNEEYLEKRRSQISLDTTLADYADGECIDGGNPWNYQSGKKKSGNYKNSTIPNTRPGHTTHFSVADNEGNVAAVTTSINSGMGSGLMVPDYGFMLNNYMVLFDVQPGGPNQPNGGKGPLSSTSATIAMKNGEPYFTSGSPGGTTIPQTTTQIILNVVGYGMNINDAVHEPRITPERCSPIGWEKEVNGQEGIPDNVRAKLSELGHVWDEEPGGIGAANNLLINNGTYEGGDDPRRDGVAVGISEIYTDNE